MYCGALGAEESVQDVAVLALLPRVVKVGSFALWSWSQGPRDARLPPMRSQPAAARQHSVFRVSVFGLPHGSLGRVWRGGLAMNAFHRARYGDGAAEASPLSVPS